MKSLIILTPEELFKLERGESIEFICNGIKTEMICENERKEKMSKEENPQSEVPQDMEYAGYSSHDDESWYRCPKCQKQYGSWGFVNGRIKLKDDVFTCECGTLLKRPR